MVKAYIHISIYVCDFKTIYMLKDLIIYMGYNFCLVWFMCIIK